jgi:hypothetical protein
VRTLAHGFKAEGDIGVDISGYIKELWDVRHRAFQCGDAVIARRSQMYDDTARSHPRGGFDALLYIVPVARAPFFALPREVDKVRCVQRHSNPVDCGLISQLARR